jgi:tetratricopeptide (TPR) repeat protein
MPLDNVQGWAYMGMARCYERLGQPQKAIEAYRTLLAEHPQHPKAREARATIARLTQSIEEAKPGAKKPD